MAGPSTTRNLGGICRIYKNADDKVIAIDSLEAVICIRRIGNNLATAKFHRTLDSVHTKRTLLHLDTGSRVISTIQTIGDYSSITTDAGNFFTVTWNKSSDNENDVTFSLEPYVAKLGDTV